MLKRKLVKKEVPATAPKPIAAPAATVSSKKERGKLVNEDPDEDPGLIPGEEDDEEEAEAVPAKGRKKAEAGSLADAFNKVPLNASANDIPTGKYEAIIREVVIQDFDPNKGQSIRTKFELCDPSLGDKNQVTTWSKIIDKNRKPVDGGIMACKAMLAKLGYEMDDIDEDELQECFDEINSEPPGVLVKITYDEGKDGNIYQRARVDSTCDNDIIERYKDTVPM